MDVTVAMPADRPRIDKEKAPTKTCRICSDSFVCAETWPHAIVCSHACRLALWGTEHGHALESLCVYCGDPATDADHVPPKKARLSIETMGERHLYPFMIVPACGECNSAFLGGRQLWTLPERYKFVDQALRKKYAKALAMPDWAVEELEELGPNMFGVVSGSLRVKAWVTSRLEWALARQDEWPE